MFLMLQLLQPSPLGHYYCSQLAEVKAELKKAEAMLNMVGDPIEARGKQDDLEVGTHSV